MEEYLSFRKFIVPAIITVIFWIGVVVSVIAGIVMVLAGASRDYGGGGAMVLMGLAYIILGPLVVRIYCELIILGFRIYDTLVEIRNGMAQQPPTTAP